MNMTTLFSNECAVKKELVKTNASKPGLRGKVDAACIRCRYDSRQKGTWRKQVEGCIISCCPLYTVRTKANSRKSK